jgi:imidazolonepropionase-like amidohydrolase
MPAVRIIVIATLLAMPSASRATLQGQALPDTTEQGEFTIYNIQQRVGTERYSIVREGDVLVHRATWSFKHLGGSGELATELRTTRAGQPIAFRMKGPTSTWTQADVEVAFSGPRYTARSESMPTSGVTPAGAFPAGHYPPTAIAQALFRHWQRLGRPARIPLLPAGEATFTRTGADTVMVEGRREVLARYLVTGLIWGRQSLWVDGTQRVIAAIGGNAELDRSEYIRTGYESAMPRFVAGAVADGMAAIEALTPKVAPTHTGTFAIRGARIVDATGAAPIANGTVVVVDGRIAAVGSAAQVAIPRGTAIIDGTGKTVLPGLWDMHVHYEQVEWPFASLAAGVTTVRDAANEWELITALRAAQRAGRILSPTILAAGVVDGGTEPLGVIVANTEAEARAVVQKYHAAGFEQIKIYGSLPPALVPVVTAEAHRLGITVTGHVPRGMTARQFIEAGADQINHMSFQSLLRVGREPVNLASDSAKAGIQFLLEHRTVLDPSLSRGEEGGHWRGHYELVEPGVLRVPLELRVPLQSTGTDSARAVASTASQIRSANIVKALRDAGVPIVLGTDLTVPGFSIYRDMELAVRGGFTPMEAIQAATIVPARAMRKERESGTVEVGKRADLIIVDGNPLEQIGQIRRVERVVIGGRVYRSAELWALAGFVPQ